MVTPSYQQGQFLEETLRSVLLQGYPDLEYIVIDGGSTDGSVEILERYAPWLTYWSSEPDDGQSDALRKGFGRATGEILAWLNSDDRYRPGALLAAAAELRRHPGAGVVYAHSAVCNAEGVPLGYAAGRAFDLGEMAHGNNCVAQPSAFFTRSAYARAGGLDADLHYVMDMDLWLRIASVAEVVFVDDTWADFRHHAGSKTGQGELSFDREIYGVVTRTFDSGSLPEELATQRRRALAGLRMRLAYRHYQLAEDGPARRHALAAAIRDPRILLDGRQRVIFVRALLGRSVVCGIRRRFGRHADG